jgi:hypothetical protein
MVYNHINSGVSVWPFLWVIIFEWGYADLNADSVYLDMGAARHE